VQALKRGAYDYITKPVDDELSHLVANALEHKRARREVVRLRENCRRSFEHGTDRQEPAMKKVTELIEMVAPTASHGADHGRKRHGQGSVAGARFPPPVPRRYCPWYHPLRSADETLPRERAVRHEKGRSRAAVPQERQFEMPTEGQRVAGRDQRHPASRRTDLLRVLQEKGLVRVGGQPANQGGFRCMRHQNLPRQKKEGKPRALSNQRDFPPSL